MNDMLPTFAPPESRAPSAPCQYCSTTYHNGRFVNTGMIPVVLQETIDEWGDKAWDTQSMVACSCGAGLALAADEKKPMRSFLRAVELGQVTGWQTRRMPWGERNHYLVFGGPEAAEKFTRENATKSFDEIMAGIGGKK